MTILQAMRDPKLFGRWFAGESWTAWRAFLAALFGLPMTDEELAIYRRHTGRTAPPTTPLSEAWCIAGRRAGKSRIAALVAVYLATCRDYSAKLAPGEVATVMVLAADKRQARVIFRYCHALLTRVPMCRALLIGETKESLTLKGNVCIEIHAVNAARTRGYSAAAVLADECCFWPAEASDVIAALRPTLMPGALLLAISSPWAKRGVAFEQHTRYHGVEGAPVLTWSASTLEQNPTFNPETVAAAEQADATSARTEYGGRWMEDASSYISREQLSACVVEGRRALPPLDRHIYFGGLDVAGGSGSDSMTMAIAHIEDGRAVLDITLEQEPPFSPAETTARFATVFREYRCGAQSDRYAGDWPVEAFQKHRVTVSPCPRNRSECYIELLASLTTPGKVELLDDAKLVGQFADLWKRPGRLRQVVDHVPGGHDDRANAVAIALLQAIEHGASAVICPPVSITRVSPWGEYTGPVRW